jgi:hypothetical protein
MIQANNSDQQGARDADGGQELIRRAEQRVRQGLAPPPEIYRIEYRRCVDWSNFPGWARPVDPQIFEGCCHEG